jgi:hypothetical protein
VLSTAPSFFETPEFALSVAVVDTRSLAGAGNHCEGSVALRKQRLLFIVLTNLCFSSFISYVHCTSN